MFSTLWQNFHRMVFPVKRDEYRFFMPIFFLYFALAFIYNGLRPLKITLVTSLSSAGAEVIPFLKVWGIVPGAFFFTYLFTLLSRRFSREHQFYIMMSIFLSYYLFFAVALFPYSELWSLDSLAEILNSILPLGFRGLVSMIQFWHVSIFYIMCEVWSSVVMFMLFWGFVNEVTPLKSASRFYPLYNLGGNLASTCSGLLLMKFSQEDYTKFFLPNLSSISKFALVVISLSFIVGLVAMGLFRHLHKQVLPKNLEGLNFEEPKEAKSSRVFTLSDSIMHVVRSKYLSYLLVLVVAYNLVFNLTDVLWSQEVKNYFQADQIGMAGFIGKVTMYKGILSTFFVFLAHLIIRKFGWKWATLVTPLIILSTSLLFFPLISLQENETFRALVYDFFTTSATWLAVVLGGGQNAMARGTKYSIYDSTREMAYIPLSRMEMRKGKAVIDGIASRIGKSSGSVIFMILLPLCSSLQNTIPIVALISISVTIIWVFSIVRLDKLMREKNRKLPKN